MVLGKYNLTKRDSIPIIRTHGNLHSEEPNLRTVQLRMDSPDYQPSQGMPSMQKPSLEYPQKVKMVFFGLSKPTAYTLSDVHIDQRGKDKNALARRFSAFLAFLALSSASASAQTGYATYYTVQSCKREGTSGVYTASGERYNESKLTCALPNHKFGRLYKVYSPQTRRSVIVRHNDYGPGRTARARNTVIDLTPAAFLVLGLPLSKGRIEVEVTPYAP